MVSVRKSRFKRILISIIAFFLIFCISSMVATKIIYDSIFVRYDHESTGVPDELYEFVLLREASFFYSGETRLSGYLYKSEPDIDRDALIIIAPGFNSCADSYLWQIKRLTEYGWSVFIFDSTGCCSSEGESTVGFPQKLCDMKAAINYVESNRRFGYNDIVLLGHSQGGYAACGALGDEYDISAVVSVSGINSAMEGVIGSATNYVGPLAYGNYGFLWLYQAMLFGKETLNTTAKDQINKSDVPVLIIHGDNDTTVPYDRYSIISHKDDITSDKVQYVVRSAPNHNGHTDLLFDDDGTANDALMREIHNFLIKNIK